MKIHILQDADGALLINSISLTENGCWEKLAAMGGERLNYAGSCVEATIVADGLLLDIIAYFESAENIRVRAEADLTRRLREALNTPPPSPPVAGPKPQDEAAG